MLDLSNVPLTRGSVDVLSDLLSVPFGLRKLVLENCSLDDDSLKPLIHSLLVSGTLPTLSLANNKRIRAKGWKLVAVLVKRSRELKHLDLSENLVDRKIAEIIVAALAGRSGETLRQDRQEHMAAAKGDAQESRNGHVHAQDVGRHGDAAAAAAAASASASNENGPPTLSLDDDNDDHLPPYWAAPLLFASASSRRVPLSSSSSHPARSTSSLDPAPAAGLTSLRLESCAIKNPALDALAHGIRCSALKHVSLRKNRIGVTGAVALAVMIRDYELPSGGAGGAAEASSSSTAAAAKAANGHAQASLFPSGMFSPTISLSEDRPASPRLGAADLRNGDAMPPVVPPKSAAATASGPVQHRTSSASVHSAPANPVTARLEAVAAQATATSGPARSASLLSTASTLVDEPDDGSDSFGFGPERDRNRGRAHAHAHEREAQRHAELKARLRKQIDALPRVGCLLTLDVRSNEIKGGVSYISQVLKRNRTLKVLNLSDNKIDAQGLTSIAEALVSEACCGDL